MSQRSWTPAPAQREARGRARDWVREDARAMTRDDEDGDGMTAWGEGGAHGGGTWWYRESARAVEAKTRVGVGVGVGRTWDVVGASWV